MTGPELLSTAIFVAKLTLWCLAPFAALYWLRRRSAAERHALVLATILGALLLPLATIAIPSLGPGFLNHPATPSAPTPSPAPTPIFSTPTTPSSVAESSTRSNGPERRQPTPTNAEIASVAPSRTRSIPPSQAVLAICGLGTLLALLQLGFRWARLRGLVRRADIIETPAVLDELDHLSREVGLRTAPDLLESGEISVPIAVDLVSRRPNARRSIVLPRGWSSAPSAALRAALLHELAHLRRRDGSATLACAISVALYWWHPLVRRLAVWARQEAEKAADDIVLLHGESPTNYADHLLYFARNARQQPALGVPLMIPNRSDLKSRVLSILDSRRRRQPIRRRWIAPIGFLLLLVAPLSGLRIVAESEASIGDLGLLRLGPAPIDLSPFSDGSDTPVRIAQHGDDHHRHDSHDEAEMKAKKSKRSDSEYSRAYELYNESRYAEAATAFAAAADAGEKTATAYYNAACSAALADEPEAALAYLQSSIDAGWDDPQHIVKDDDLDRLRGDARFQALVDALFETVGETRHPIEGHRLRLIEERHRFLLESDSQDGTDWYKNGTALLSLRNVGDAEFALERAASLLGHRGDSALYNLACAYAVSGRSGEAIDALRRAVEAGYSDVDHMRQDPDLRSIRELAGFREVEQLAMALDLNRFRDWPEEIEDGTWTEMGTEYERGRWDEAIQFYRDFTASNPEIGRAWYNLGWAYHHARRFGDAVAPFERAAANGYSPANAAYNIACGHALRNATEEAFAWLDTAVERGFTSVGTLEKDDDLASLRSDPRLQRLIWKLEASDRY